MESSAGGRDANKKNVNVGGVSSTGRLFMGVLALQFGLQPVLQKACVGKDNVNPFSLIIGSELTKIVLCVLVILSSGRSLYGYVPKRTTPTAFCSLRAHRALI